MTISGSHRDRQGCTREMGVFGTPVEYVQSDVR